MSQRRPNLVLKKAVIHLQITDIRLLRLRGNKSSKQWDVPSNRFFRMCRTSRGTNLSCNEPRPVTHRRCSSLRAPPSWSTLRSNRPGRGCPARGRQGSGTRTRTWKNPQASAGSPILFPSELRIMCFKLTFSEFNFRGGVSGVNTVRV